MIPEHAAQKLASLEQAIGAAMPGIPTGQRDQLSATIRDDFNLMGVDINDPHDAEVAFAGVFILADAMFSEPLANAHVAQFTAYLLRNLYDRAEGDVVNDAMPIFKPSWRVRVMDWLFR